MNREIDDRPMRIALVTPMFPVPHDHTRGRYIYETARCLARIARVRILQQPRYPDLPFIKARNFLHERIPSDYQMQDVDVQTSEYVALPAVSRPFNGFVSAASLIPQMRSFDPDVVLAYWLYPDGFAAVRAAATLGKPAVIGALGSDVHVPNRIGAFFSRRAVRRADGVLAVSEHMRRAIIRDLGGTADKVHAVVNGFNHDIFRPLPRAACRAALGLPESRRQIVYVGRLVREKGLLELLEAFTALAGHDPALDLALVGDGIMRHDLEGRLSAEGLQGRVRLVGGKDPQGVAQWIGASDLLCLPSWSEGYPNVVVEALACGRPVVATDVGGTSEIVRGGNGLLVKPRDASALKQALQQVLAATWSPDSLAATVTRSWDDVARETADVCRAVVAGRGK